MSHWDFGRLPADRHDAAIHPADDRTYPLGGVRWNGGLEALDGEGGWPYPTTYKRDPIEPPATRPASDDWFAGDQFEGGRYVPDQVTADRFAGDQLASESWLRAPESTAWPPQPQPQHGESRHGGEAGLSRHWLTVVCVAVAVATLGAASVFFLGGHAGNAAARGTAMLPASPTPSGQAASRTAAPSTAAKAPSTTAKTPSTAAKAPSTAAIAAPPLSVAEAQGVLAGYTAVNNSANAERGDALLATVETGSSDAIDKAAYQTQRATGAAPFPAFGPASATYYLPRSEPAAGPRWFAVRVSNAFLSHPAKVTSVEYLLFLQAKPGGPWRNAIEPYLLSGTSAPQVAIGGDGLATAVAITATSLPVAPVQLPKLTATSLDGTGPIAAPGNLADRTDERFWKGEAPTLTITDSHAPATAGQAFALLTTGGGALVFYTVAASVTITPPAGTTIHLTVPGLYSAAQSLHRAVLDFRDQFAAYDPPAGGGTPRIIADYSGITGKA
jgi:hypothetical protein